MDRLFDILRGDPDVLFVGGVSELLDALTVSIDVMECAREGAAMTRLGKVHCPGPLVMASVAIAQEIHDAYAAIDNQKLDAHPERYPILMLAKAGA